jgi:hypothetical protein
MTGYPDITQLRNTRLSFERPAIYSNLISVVLPGLLLLGSIFPRTFVLGYSRIALREKEDAQSLVVTGSLPSRELR